MNRPIGKLDRIARECGVEIRAYGKTSRTRYKLTHARRTLKGILRKHGEGHVRLTLRCIVESSKENSTQLYTDVIGAVSDVLYENPEVAQMNGLLDAFEALSLTDIRRSQMKAFRTARRHRIAAILHDRLVGGGDP